MFGGAYSNRRVLLTGRSGFKGSWLGLWLERLGAKVVGYSLPPPTKPSHYELLALPSSPSDVVGDILDLPKLKESFATFRPEIVFHLAAQPLVRLSYDEPLATFATNVLGTANVLESARACPSVKAIVVVTSDKCYENLERGEGYREGEKLGGHDPYSASKACAEIVSSSYRRSFFERGRGPLLATCRAGNVVGGGDWAADRLLPDIMKAVAEGRVVELRNPASTRPWQHVLEPLSGYLLVGERLLEGSEEVASAWNFGPDAEGSASVGRIAELIGEIQPAARFSTRRREGDPHEAGLLGLDCSKAKELLGWRPVWDLRRALERSVLWYAGHYEGRGLRSLSDLSDYCQDAERKGLEWAK